MLYRGYTVTGSLSATQYLAATKFKAGTMNHNFYYPMSPPNFGDTDLLRPVPLENGTVNDDGASQFTGTAGGDNTTDNTVTYKDGGGVTDVTAQNLITNTSSTDKSWFQTTLDVNLDKTKPFGFWLYANINCIMKLALNTSPYDTIEIHIATQADPGIDMYYVLKVPGADLIYSTEYDYWSWISSGTTNIEDLPVGTGGTPTGALDHFWIHMKTDNATDTWNSGDCIFDLLRQWTVADTLGSFPTGYPSLDLTNNEATTICPITSLQAIGFRLTDLGLFNEDTIPLMTSRDAYEDESKTADDEFTLTVVDRIL